MKTGAPQGVAGSTPAASARNVSVGLSTATLRSIRRRWRRARGTSRDGGTPFRSVRAGGLPRRGAFRYGSGAGHGEHSKRSLARFDPSTTCLKATWPSGKGGRLQSGSSSVRIRPWPLSCGCSSVVECLCAKEEVTGSRPAVRSSGKPRGHGAFVGWGGGCQVPRRPRGTHTPRSARGPGRNWGI